MKTQQKTQTAEQTLQSSLADAKHVYQQSVKRAKLRYKYKTASPESAAKMLLKMISSTEEKQRRMAESFFGGDDYDRKLIIARVILKKSRVVKAHISESSNLFFTSKGPKLGNTHYQIEYYVKPQLRIRHRPEYAIRPTPELVKAVTHEYFPAVTQIEMV